MKQELLVWFLDLISPWLVPRAEYDERLEKVNKTDRENCAMLEVHRDYVKAQLQAPELNRVFVRPDQGMLVYYSQPEAWPPLWNKPNVLNVTVGHYHEERTQIEAFHCEMRVDRKVLEHYQKYSVGLFHIIAQKLLLLMVSKLMKSS